MLINLTDVFASEGKDRRESLAYEENSFFYMGNNYMIREKSPVNMTFTNIGTGKVMICGDFKLVLEIPCDRCLETVAVPLEVKFEQEVVSPDNENQEEKQSGQSFMLGYELDTEAFMNGEILVNMPVKVLCKPDCKGICKQCGHNLNEE